MAGVPHSAVERADYRDALQRLAEHPVLLDNMTVTGFAKVDLLAAVRSAIGGRTYLAESVHNEAARAVHIGVPGTAAIFEDPPWFEVVPVVGAEISHVEALRESWASMDRKELTQTSDRGEAESVVLLKRPQFAPGILLSDDTKALRLDGRRTDNGVLRIRSTTHLMVKLIVEDRVPFDDMWTAYERLVIEFGMRGLLHVMPPNDEGRKALEGLVAIAAATEGHDSRVDPGKRRPA